MFIKMVSEYKDDFLIEIFSCMLVLCATSLSDGIDYLLAQENKDKKNTKTAISIFIFLLIAFIISASVIYGVIYTIEVVNELSKTRLFSDTEALLNGAIGYAIVCFVFASVVQLIIGGSEHK